MKYLLVLILFYSVTKIHGQVPPAPNLVSPHNNTFGASLAPDLQWQAVAGADSFFVMVSSDSNFSNVVYYKTTAAIHQQMPMGIIVLNTAYYWKVRGKNSFGNGAYSARWRFWQEATGVENNSGLIRSFSLSQNYPNPFNPTTKINYELPITNFVSVKVYDALGNEVQTLVNEKQNAGSYSVNFNVASLPSGIYFYKLITEKFSETKKMILIK